MKRVSTIEMLQNGVSIGYSCVINQKGQKPIGILEDNKLKVFPTEKEAHQFGKDFDVTNIKPS